MSDSLQPRGLWPTKLLHPWEFSRQECWRGLPFLSPGDLPDPGIKPGSPALEADALTSEPPGEDLESSKLSPKTTSLTQKSLLTFLGNFTPLNPIWETYKFIDSFILKTVELYSEKHPPHMLLFCIWELERLTFFPRTFKICFWKRAFEATVGKSYFKSLLPCFFFFFPSVLMNKWTSKNFSF